MLLRSLVARRFSFPVGADSHYLRGASRSQGRQILFGWNRIAATVALTTMCLSVLTSMRSSARHKVPVVIASRPAATQSARVRHPHDSVVCPERVAGLARASAAPRARARLFRQQLGHADSCQRWPNNRRPCACERARPGAREHRPLSASSRRRTLRARSSRPPPSWPVPRAAATLASPASVKAGSAALIQATSRRHTSMHPRAGSAASRPARYRPSDKPGSA